MYKKIKNGSFMNLIWFIICILPILLLVVYSFAFIGNKSQGDRIDNIINYERDFVETFSSETEFYNNELDFRYFVYSYSENDNINIDTNYNTISGGISEQSVGNQDLFYFDFDDNEDLYFYLKVVNYPDTAIFEINVDEENYSISNDTLYKYHTISNGGMGTPILSFESNGHNSTYKLFLFVSKVDIPLYYFENLDNWNYINFGNGFENYLNSIVYTIQTNGFISNAFLNLSTLFGVNNVYYSLACYYIEYLLVIVLLHLAFDVLYMLPNICHKFMEKIGGERD